MRLSTVRVEWQPRINVFGRWVFVSSKDLFTVRRRNSQIDRVWLRSRQIRQVFGKMKIGEQIDKVRITAQRIRRRLVEENVGEMGQRERRLSVSLDDSMDRVEQSVEFSLANIDENVDRRLRGSIETEPVTNQTETDLHDLSGVIEWHSLGEKDLKRRKRRTIVLRCFSLAVKTKKSIVY